MLVSFDLLFSSELVSEILTWFGVVVAVGFGVRDREGLLAGSRLVNVVKLVGDILAYFGEVVLIYVYLSYHEFFYYRPENISDLQGSHPPIYVLPEKHVNLIN